MNLVLNHSIKISKEIMTLISYCCLLMPEFITLSSSFVIKSNNAFKPTIDCEALYVQIRKSKLAPLNAKEDEHGNTSEQNTFSKERKQPLHHFQMDDVFLDAALSVLDGVPSREDRIVSKFDSENKQTTQPSFHREGGSAPNHDFPEQKQPLHSMDMDGRFINAALSVYDKISPPEEPAIPNFDLRGFKTQSYMYPKDKIIVVAFRGSENIKDYQLNLGLAIGGMDTYTRLEKVYRSLVGPSLKPLERAIASISERERQKNCRLGFVSKCVLMGENEKRPTQDDDDQDRPVEKLHFHPDRIASDFLEIRIEAIRRYLKDLQISFPADQGYRIYVTGHSLGGYFAQIASMMTGLPGASFNAPGVTDLVQRCQNFERHELDDPGDNFVNHRLQGDLISKFAESQHYGRIIVHKTKSRNPFTNHNINTIKELYDNGEWND